MTTAASDVESKLPGSDGGRTVDSLHDESVHYERKGAKFVKCGGLCLAVGVFAALGAWTGGAFSTSASDVLVQSSAAPPFKAKSGKSDKPSCEPDLASNVCEGIEYYELVNATDIGRDPAATTIPWTAFLKSTFHGGPLENCVLAPVTSVADLNEIAVAAGKEPFTYVGVRKSANLVVGKPGSQKIWFNLDGTPVPNKDAIWVQANNKFGLQAYAVYVLGKGLDDIENYPVRSSTVFNKAVMKCCGDIPKTFCTAA